MQQHAPSAARSCWVTFLYK